MPVVATRAVELDLRFVPNDRRVAMDSHLIGEIGFQAVYAKASPESMYASLDTVSPSGLMSSKSSAWSL